MSSPGRFGFSFSKFPTGEILFFSDHRARVATGNFRRSFQFNCQNSNDSTVKIQSFRNECVLARSSAFVTVNKFFNPRTIVQIAKDTSFFAIMAIGMTVVIITGRLIFLWVSSMLWPRSVVPWYCRRMVPPGGAGATVLGIIVTIVVGTSLRFSQRSHDDVL